MRKTRWVVALADDRFAGDYKKGDKMQVVDDVFIDRRGDNRSLELGLIKGYVEFTEHDYTLKKFEKDIRKFNERCGNVDCTPEMSLAKTCNTVLPQAKVILEEAKELLKACEEQDEQEILDGSIDVLVTSLRLLSLLGKRYDLMKAAELVMENNHLKYTDDVKLLEQWVVASPPDIYGESSEIGGKKYYYLKDLNGKIRKWVGFPKVELKVEELLK
jgi:hypothetical protein